MEEISFKELFHYFKSKMLWILLVTVACGIFGCLYSLFIQTPLYQSSTTIVLAQSSDSGSGNTITQNDILLNQKLIGTYRQIIKSRKILNQVIQNLKLNITATELASYISVTTESNTDLIRIGVSNQDNELACKIANEIAKVFNREIVNIYSIKNVNIIDQAEISDVPYNINTPKRAILSLLIGLILSCSIVFGIYYFDNRIKTVEEVENKLNLPILGAVPSMHKGKKGD